MCWKVIPKRYYFSKTVFPNVMPKMVLHFKTLFVYCPVSRTQTKFTETFVSSCEHFIEHSKSESICLRRRSSATKKIQNSIDVHLTSAAASESFKQSRITHFSNFGYQSPRNVDHCRRDRAFTIRCPLTLPHEPLVSEKLLVARSRLYRHRVLQRNAPWTD